MVTDDRILDPQDLPEMCSPEQLGKWLGVSVHSVYQWCAMGTAPRRYRIGKHTRFMRADVIWWLQQREVE